MFQLKILFKLENNHLPKEMDRLMLSFFKAATERYSKDMFNALYDKCRSIIKTYTYSFNLPGAAFVKDGIELQKNEFTMFFSDADQGELMMFFNAFQGMKYQKYPMAGNSMQLVSIYIQNMNEIKDDEIIIRMSSPLIVRRHNSDNNSDKYYVYNTDGFEQTLKENIDIFIDRINIPVKSDSFGIEPIKAKKVVIPVFGRNTDASLGIFKLKGDRNLLNLLYMAGIGARRSEGKGKFDILA